MVEYKWVDDDYNDVCDQPGRLNKEHLAENHDFSHQVEETLVDKFPIHTSGGEGVEKSQGR